MGEKSANSATAARNHANSPSGDDEAVMQRIGHLFATFCYLLLAGAYNRHLLQGKHASFGQYALLEPPVTEKTLSELNVNRIPHDPKLRHDLNFDPDLKFRLDPDSEEVKKRDTFYELMRTQLSHFFTSRENFNSTYENVEWCLPATLRAIRGILETLVPHRDRPSVEETFNVDLLMQQFNKGVADLPKLSQWLSQLLKCHCAPMRDGWVDEMASQISIGSQEGNVARLVLVMKLDVANDQVKRSKLGLIQNTIPFEQKFFRGEIALDRVNVEQAYAWFRNAKNLPDIDFMAQPKDDLWDVMKALVDLTLQPTNTPYPDTFVRDTGRLHKLHADIDDIIKLEICMQLFRRLQADSRRQPA
ncbi:T-complex protein 11-domain-containing protein, partial [Bisporella sp. PMI_857]